MSKNDKRPQANKRFVRDNTRQLWVGYKGGPHEDANLQRNRRNRQKSNAIKESLESWSDE